jgi:menaquinone-specific isochorismate synthase
MATHSEIHEFRVRSRGYLPHFEQRGLTYFVTFRLADSLPTSVLKQFKNELAAKMRGLSAKDRSGSQEKDDTPAIKIKQEYEEKIQRYLDKGIGACFMNNPTIAQIVEDALKYFDEKRYHLYVLSVMPNHVHVLFRPFEEMSLDKVLHSWKSYSAKQANAILNRQGIFWQQEYYDHLIRSEKEFYQIQEYILNNPIAAGLRDWKWVGYGNIFAEQL